MDVLFINGIDFVSGSNKPQIGQLILKNIITSKYNSEYVNFDYLHNKNIIQYRNTLEENIELFVNYIIDKKAKIVGFYAISNSFLYSIRIAEKLKERCSATKIIFGGPHVTLTTSKCLEYFNFIDLIMIGEGEANIMSTIDALLHEKPLDKIAGIAYRKDNKIVINNRNEYLDSSNLGEYTVYDYSPYIIEKDTVIDLEGGRGCPYQCTFCSTSLFWGRKFRVKPPHILVNEMNKFNERYAVTNFSIVHDMFTANKKHIHDFCNLLIHNKMNYRWSCSSRVDVLDKETLILMKKANCTRIYLGIESGSTTMQKKINKNLDLTEAFHTISIMKELDFKIIISFIYGFIDETIENINETLAFIENIMLLDLRNVQLHKFMTLPETIDTNKIKNELTFNKEDVDFSIYDKKVMDKKSEELIDKYKDVFIQYYSFQTEARGYYKRLDYFIYMVASVMGIYNLSIKYLITQVGLSTVYKEFEKEIEYKFITDNKINIPDAVVEDYNIISLKELMYEILSHYENKLESEYFTQVLRFENILNEYIDSKNKDNKIFEFPIDIIDTRLKGTLIEKKTYIRFSYDGKKPRVSKVSFSDTRLINSTC